jgi:hypothetical protein
MAEGDTMQTDSDPEQGIFVVMSGLVQVTTYFIMQGRVTRLFQFCYRSYI